MFGWIKDIVRDRFRFSIPQSTIPLPRCHVRPITTQDFDACDAIYRLNEAKHFPNDYFGVFSDWLRNQTDLILVAEVEGRVRAFGGVARYSDAEYAVLNFGMVHPDFQRHRLGTVLVLSRLAVLPEPDWRWAVLLSTTGGSHTYFERFGFHKIGRFPDERGTVFDTYRSHVYRTTWAKSRADLQEAQVGLAIEGVSVPTIPVPKARRMS